MIKFWTDSVKESPQKNQWEYLRTYSLVEAVHKAREMGWYEKKVQVRMEPINSDTVEYVIEPFEKDCSCPLILKYTDYFLRPEET